MAKLPYWLDANVFIESNNGGLNIDIAPSFWVWLETRLKEGTLRSSSLGYDELLGKEDLLAKWARVRKGPAYWPEPDDEVQAAYREIAEYVDQQYADASPAKVGDFLAKADCWIIAHSLAKGGTVVTRESKVDKTSKTPKVPNVCERFEVPFIQTFAMFKTLGLKLYAVARIVHGENSHTFGVLSFLNNGSVAKRRCLTTDGMSVVRDQVSLGQTVSLWELPLTVLL